LVREVLALKQGDHLCLIYDADPAEQLPALLPYLQQGLELGERCIYVADDLTTDQLRSALAGYGIDVDEEEKRGRLVLWTRQDWRQPGELDSEKKAAQARSIIEDALQAGFRGVRFAIEMTWTLGPDIDIERLLHWEATLNTIVTPDSPCRMICQYSRDRLTPAAIHAALSTHPIAILGSQVAPNPRYEFPDGDSAASGLADWLGTVVRPAALEQAADAAS
jgi:hypothetical protein